MFWTVTQSLLGGFGKTIEIFILTLLFSLPLGLILSIGEMSKAKWLSGIIKIFIWIIRGTPLMLQLIVVFYGPGLLAAMAQNAPTQNALTQLIGSFKVSDRFLAVIVAFVINYACYFSEIYRGGIESISKGQYEAGQVLGMTKSEVFFKIILLQVVKRIVPPISNEIITLVKDTSLARIIAVYEIIWAGQSFIKSDGLLWPLFYTGVFYLIFSGILTLLLNKAEKKLSYFEI